MSPHTIDDLTDEEHAMVMADRELRKIKARALVYARDGYADETLLQWVASHAAHLVDAYLVHPCSPMGVAKEVGRVLDILEDVDVEDLSAHPARRAWDLCCLAGWPRPDLFTVLPWSAIQGDDWRGLVTVQS